MLPVRPTLTRISFSRVSALRRRELVCDGPPGLAANRAHVTLEVERIDLDHNTVAPIVEALEPVPPSTIVAEGVLGGLDEPVVGVGLEAEPGQVFEVFQWVSGMVASA